MRVPNVYVYFSRIDQHTIPIAFFTCFMWSKLTVRCTKRLAVSSTPGAPLIGVFVSCKNTSVAINSIISTKVFHISVIPDQIANMNHQNQLELLEESAWVLVGTVGNASGSDVFLVHARRSDMRDAPSPIEWWSRNTATASAYEVLTLRRCTSHNGLERSRGAVVRFEM